VRYDLVVRLTDRLPSEDLIKAFADLDQVSRVRFR
jgi:hypothetical protein